MYVAPGKGWPGRDSCVNMQSVPVLSWGIPGAHLPWEQPCCSSGRWVTELLILILEAYSSLLCQVGRKPYLLCHPFLSCSAGWEQPPLSFHTPLPVPACSVLSRVGACAPAAVAVPGAEPPAWDPRGASSTELIQSSQNLSSLLHCFLFGAFFPLGAVPRLAYRGCSSLGRS